MAYCAQTSHDTSDDLNFLLTSRLLCLPECTIASQSPSVMQHTEHLADFASIPGKGRASEAYLADEPDDDARLDLGQTIFRANLLAGSQADSRFAIGFAADLINVATRSYHDQDYDLAIKYGSSALDVRPDSVDVRRYVAQALIRKERYDEAEEHISELLRLGEQGGVLRAGLRRATEASILEAIGLTEESRQWPPRRRHPPGTGKLLFETGIFQPPKSIFVRPSSSLRITHM